MNNQCPLIGLVLLLEVYCTRMMLDDITNTPFPTPIGNGVAELSEDPSGMATFE